MGKHGPLGPCFSYTGINKLSFSGLQYTNLIFCGTLLRVFEQRGGLIT